MTRKIYLAFWLSAPLWLCAACTSASAPVRFEAGDTWKLPGTPAVKMVQTGAGELAVLVEDYASVVAEGNASYGGVVDFPRRVFVLRKGGPEAEELQGAAQDGELVTDIAAGPEPGSLWVLTIRWNNEDQVLEHRLALFVGTGSKRGVTSFALEPAHFESDVDVPGDTVRYSPSGGDTNDVARLATAGERVGLIALNAVGTVYADRYTYRAGELTRTSRTPLTQPRRSPHQNKYGSTYDVFGWLQNILRVHATMSAEGVLYAAMVLQKSEIGTVDERWGSHLADGLGDAGEFKSWFAVLFTVSAGGNVQPAEARVLGPYWDSLLLTLDFLRGRCFYGGLAREGENYISKLVLFELGGPKRVIDSTHNAAALQAVAVDSTGQVWAAGSWNWTQAPPSGVSITGGERFLSPLPEVDQPWTEQNVLSPSSRRSEARALLEPAPGVLCVAGMDNGPDTHAADGNIALLLGDGFVECRAWPGDEG